MLGSRTEVLPGWELGFQGCSDEEGSFCCLTNAREASAQRWAKCSRRHEDAVVHRNDEGSLPGNFPSSGGGRWEQK